VKQNLLPRNGDAACDIDGGCTAAGMMRVRGRIPRAGWAGKRDRQGSGETGKQLRRRAFGARGADRPVSEIRNIRMEKVEESGHSARCAHAVVRGENVDIYSRRSVQNVNIYSRDGTQNVNIYSFRRSKMLTSIRVEAPAADVAREQPGNPDGVQIRTWVQRAEGRILRFGSVQSTATSMA